MPNVYIILGEGISIRNFIHSGILNKLNQKSEYKFIPLIYNEKFADFVDDGILLKKIKIPRHVTLLLKVLRQRFYRINVTKSTEILRKSPLYKSWKSKLIPLLTFPFPKNERVFKVIHNFTMRRINTFLDQQTFDVPVFTESDVVISTNPISLKENIITIMANRHGSKTIGIVKSFDNITTKGFILELPKHLCVWNQKMFFEAVSLYEIDADKVHIIGAPHFNSITVSDKNEKKHLALYATVAHELNPFDTEIVRRLAQQLSDLEFIVRLHQNDKKARWKNFSMKNVTVFDPSKSTVSHERVSKSNHLSFLEKQLEQSFLTINTASTLCLEALAKKVPSVCIAFSLDDISDIKRYYDFEHFKYLRKSKNIYFCYSFEELIEAINMVQKYGWINDEEVTEMILGPKNTPELLIQVINA